MANTRKKTHFTRLYTALLYVSLCLLAFCTRSQKPTALTSVDCNGYTSKLYTNPAGVIPHYDAPSFNLVCESALLDRSAPQTWAFPASSLAGNYPAGVSLMSNETPAQTYFTTDNSIPDESSPPYAAPIVVTKDTLLQHFSVDSAGNRGVIRSETYTRQEALPQLILTSLSRTYLNVNLSATVQLTSNRDTHYEVRVNGNDTRSGGVVTASGNLLQNVPQVLTIAGSALLDGENKIYIFVWDETGISHASFYLYRDDKPPYVQALPDTGIFNYTPEIALVSLEPAVIYYTTDLSTPTTASLQYTTPILLFADTQLKFMAVDLAGNASEVVTKPYTVDVLAPVIGVNNVTAPYFNGVMYYVSPTGSIQIDWETDENAEFSVERDGAAMYLGVILDSGQLTANTPRSTVILGSTLTDGPGVIRLYAKDAAGNTSAYTLGVVRDSVAAIPPMVNPLLGWSVASLAANNVRFAWRELDTNEFDSGGAGVDYYELQYSQDPAFTSPVTKQVVIEEQYESIGLPGRYFWRVRMVDLAGNTSPWSGRRTLYVGKSAGDITGNGFDDLLAGAPAALAGQGKAYLFEGVAGCPPACNAVAKVTFIGEPGQDGNFGEKVQIIEDTNAGGAADILISAPSFDEPLKVDTGRVYLFFGEQLDTKCSSTYPCSLSAAQADMVFSGEAGGNFFGKSLASVGDFNGDGYGDFVIGSPQANTSFSASGRAYLYLGGAAPAQALTFNGHRVLENFSSSLCLAGDMNGDGYADLFIGASSGNSLAANNSGVGYLYYGSAIPNNTYNVIFFGSESSGSAFGGSCARGYDIDQDGYEELIIGAYTDPSFGSLYGKAYLYYGGSVVLTVPGYQFQAGSTSGFAGRSVLGLFLNSDLRSDILMGSPGVSAGSLYAFNGLVLNNPTTSGSPTTATQASAFDNNAGAMSLGIWGDLNNLGQDVFVSGNPEYNLQDGALHIYEGGAFSKFTILGSSGEQLGASVSSRP